MTRPIKPGDIVRLASGGPTMTVTGVNGLDPVTGDRNGIQVAWFGDGPQMYRACDTEAAFVLVEPGSEEAPATGTCAPVRTPGRVFYDRECKGRECKGWYHFCLTIGQTDHRLTEGDVRHLQDSCASALAAKSRSEAS